MNPNPKKDRVILIHGLAESAQFMSFYEASLRAAGYETVSFNYPSTLYSIEHLTHHYLHPVIEQNADAPALHFVTHSMGGILLRYYLSKNTIPNSGRIVMLTPGHAGSPTMTFLNQFSWYRAIVGPAGIQSNDDENCFACKIENPPPASIDVGVIAGNIPLDPVSWLVIREPNDGKITVKGTKIDDMKDHIVIPVSHDTILFSPLGISQTLHFLGNGAFSQSAIR